MSYRKQDGQVVLTLSKDSYSTLTFEMAQARYHSPMQESQMHESWLALRREMLRSRWAKKHGLKDEEVGIAICPRSRKAFFQWNGVLKFLFPAPTSVSSTDTSSAPPDSTTPRSRP